MKSGFFSHPPLDRHVMQPPARQKYHVYLRDISLAVFFLFFNQLSL